MAPIDNSGNGRLARLDPTMGRSPLNPITNVTPTSQPLPRAKPVGGKENNGGASGVGGASNVNRRVTTQSVANAPLPRKAADASTDTISPLHRQTLARIEARRAAGTLQSPLTSTGQWEHHPITQMHLKNAAFKGAMAGIDTEFSVTPSGNYQITGAVARNTLPVAAGAA